MAEITKALEIDPGDTVTEIKDALNLLGANPDAFTFKALMPATKERGPVILLHSSNNFAASIGGPSMPADEDDIVAGGSIMLVSLSNDTYETGATFANARQAVIDGFNSGMDEATGWNALVKPAMEPTNVVRTSPNLMTITLPAVAEYDITVDETIVFVVPAEILALSPVGLIADAPFDIVTT